MPTDSFFESELCTSYLYTLHEKLDPIYDSLKLSDIFTTLSVLSDSLLTGRPLPACLTRLRERLLYHEAHKGRRLPATVHPNNKNDHESDSDELLEDKQGVDGNEIVEELDYSAGRVDGSSIGLEELTLDVLTVRLSLDPYDRLLTSGFCDMGLF